nr:uncharacterized protein LOC112426560 isoform X2 [Macaca nemestrina]
MELQLEELLRIIIPFSLRGCMILLLCIILQLVRGDNVLAALTLSASSASASTVAAFEEPFSSPRHRGNPSLGWLRPEPPPSACREVWRKRRSFTPEANETTNPPGRRNNFRRAAFEEL